MKRLIIGPAWVGDMVMAQALAKRLKHFDQEGEIHIVAPAATLPLVARMEQISRGWLLDITHGRFDLAKRWHLAKQLKAERFDEALILPRSFKAAVIPFLAGIRHRKGAIGEMRFGLINHPIASDKSVGRTVDEFVSFARNGPLMPGEQPRLSAHEIPTEKRKAFGLVPGKISVALCPGAEYGSAKRWPARHFASLAQNLARRDISCILLGGPKERALGQAISQAATSPLVVDLTGKTTLLEVVDLLGQADMVVSNDSGLMHVAAALERPIIALYGSSSPERTPPLSGQATILATSISCRPCFKRECPFGHTDCLEKLDVARVESALIAALDRRQARPLAIT